MDDIVENQNIGKKALLLSISKMIVLTISMVISMLLSRYLTLKEYGTYSQILIVVELFVTFLILGLPNSINYFLARAEDNENRQKFLSVYYSLTTILGIIAGLLLVAFTPIIASYFKNNLISNFLYVLAILPWTKIMMSSLDSVLIVYDKAKTLIKFRIANSILILLTIIIVNVLSLTFSQYMLIYIILQSLFTIISYLLVTGVAGKVIFSLNKAIIKKIFKFSIPIGLASMLAIVKKEFDKLIIGGFYDTSKLAIYTNAAKELPITVISAALIAVLIPQMVRLFKKSKTKEAIELWGDTTALSYLFVSFFAIGIFVFAPEVMTILYSAKYLDGVAVFRIYALILLFRCTYFGMALNSMGKTKIIFYSSLITLVADIILNFVFYYIFGFIGPALSTLLTTLLSASFQLIYTSKVILVPMKRIFPWKKIINLTLLNIVFGFIFYIIKENTNIDFIDNKVLYSIILAIIWGILYFSINFKYIKDKYKKINA